jgi:hypothetical protein
MKPERLRLVDDPPKLHAPDPPRLKPWLLVVRDWLILLVVAAAVYFGASFLGAL